MKGVMTDNAPLVHVVTDEQVRGQARDMFEQMKNSTVKVAGQCSRTF